MFRKATRAQSKLRMTIDGPAGAGKTYTALRFAMALAKESGDKVAFIDTENGSASKYVGESPDGIPFEFDVLQLKTFSPDRYSEAIEAANRAGYKVLIIDSLSHAWEGKEGALEMKQKAGDSWSSWRNVTPIHTRMIDTILQSDMHVITTMRSRMEYVQEQDNRGKFTITKVGMAPIQRPGMEYEFDIVCDMDVAHILTVSKTRCPAIVDMKVDRPGAAFMEPVIEWLTSGVKETQQIKSATFSKPEQQQETITLADLTAKFTPDVIMAANDGKIPATNEKCAAIFEKLSVGEQ